MSTGHVFHPGHDDLHGITVIIFTSGPRTIVGRWDAEEGGLIAMNGVAMHESGKDPKSRDDWLADTKKFGIAVQFPRITVPRAQVSEVRRLGDWQPGAS